MELYKAKKIRKYETADNTIRLLTNKRSVHSGKADRVYNEVMTKYQNVEPMTGRLERERQAKQAAKMKTSTEKVIMYKEPEDQDAETPVKSLC